MQRRIPCQLNSYHYRHELFGGDCNRAELSAWLREGGYCLRLVYQDTGNNDILWDTQLDYYDDRGYEDMGAIASREEKSDKWTYQ